MATATRQTTRRPRQRRPEDMPEQEPLIEDTRQRVNGLAVIETHRMQNLPNVPMNILKLTLEDSSVAYACVDCPDITGTREAIRMHRHRTHKSAKDVARKDSPILQMPLGQIINAVESSLAAGSLVERLELERDRMREERDTILTKYNKLVRALDRVGFSPKMEDDD